MPMGGKCSFNLFAVIILLTVVWGLFILVSVSLTIFLFQDTILERILKPISLIRVSIGVMAFLAWIYTWKKLTEFLLYNILLRRGNSVEEGNSGG